MQSLPSFTLPGRVAIVTGSGKGIGKALALGLAQSGARLVIVARTQADIDAVVGEIEAAGGTAFGVRADVTVEEQVEELVKKAVAKFDRIDILVNNVGGGDFVPLLDLNESAWNATMDRNLRSVYLCCRAVGRVMVQQKSGNIINISSGQGTWPSPGIGTHYGAAKAAMQTFSQALAQEWGPHNIRVNVVVPGLVDTPLVRELFADKPEKVRETLAKIPLGRISQPEDLVGPVIFLASDAAAYITGATLYVRGGRFG
ncbi:MAG: 3-oxoacyl-ACP reductase FabG [Chloroflexi bacterium]|nr:3-oxoacyl-ACP reductase FabG [Chloroflexota bacterium]